MSFQLVLFTADPKRARAALGAGASAIIVDWEHKGKLDRQQGADTETNFFGPEHLLAVRRQIDGHLICRINGHHAGTDEEIESAVDNGADEVLLPMVRRAGEAEDLIRRLNGRARASILIETCEAVRLAPELGSLPLTRIYVGLNDLAIDRKSPNIFHPIVDGLLDQMRPHIRIPFGFGGLTLPDCGSPIPCRLLLGEIVRLGSSFTFLRRSFWRDVAGRDLNVEIPRILAAVSEAAARTPPEILASTARFRAAVAGLQSAPPE